MVINLWCVSSVIIPVDGFLGGKITDMVTYNIHLVMLFEPLETFDGKLTASGVSELGL